MAECSASTGSETAASAVVSPGGPAEHAACDAVLARLRREIADAQHATADWETRAERAEARLDEIRRHMAGFLAHYGGSSAAFLAYARDLAEGITQILDREPMPPQPRLPGDA